MNDDKDMARPTDQALVSDQAPAGLAASRFDPSREREVIVAWLRSAGGKFKRNGTDARDRAMKEILLRQSAVSEVFADLIECGAHWCDSDGNPEGGDSKAAPSRSDDSAGLQASPNPPSQGSQS